mmetsp:Transcript_18262/g.25676  ORF Transcript_18262/g.25676 Transcript_18262/m.25676 type:complete len:115 (+) Transcript_18262:659-1003(+)
MKFNVVIRLTINDDNDDIGDDMQAWRSLTLQAIRSLSLCSVSIVTSCHSLCATFSVSPITIKADVKQNMAMKPDTSTQTGRTTRQLILIFSCYCCYVSNLWKQFPAAAVYQTVP